MKLNSTARAFVRLRFNYSEVYKYIYLLTYIHHSTLQILIYFCTHTAISYTDAQGHELTYTTSKDKLTYDDARRRCLQHHGGDLVSISEEKEQEFIANNVIMEPSEYWIGLDDQKVEGTFEWVDG